MELDRRSQVVGFVSGLLLGAIIGAGVALLAAPDSGRGTRRRLKKAATGLKDGAADRWDELTEDVKEKVDVALKGARKHLTR
ncbi:MAG: YtxH domain-containing protein [Gemmatimonadetes bacterium]|nr:YtxH domain-containing protein [Gemmatimonadota bacterium]